MPEIGEIVSGKDIGRETRRYVWASCVTCGDQRWVEYHSFFKGKASHCVKCSARINGRKLSGQWLPNFSHRVKTDGYIWVKLPNSHPYFNMCHNKRGYVAEHRLVVAEALGRPLLRTEIIHHKNGVRDDNRLENLELLGNRGKHILITKQCQNCELQKEIRLLSWQIKELQGQIKELTSQLMFRD